MRVEWTVLISALAMVSTLGMARPASALTTITLDGASNGFVIGMAGGTARICWRDSGGNEQLQSLRTSGTGPLNDDVVIAASGGNDGGYLVQSAGHTPHPSHDCGITSWDPLQYDGHFLDIHGGDGLDVLQGAVGAGDTRLSGGNGNDILYQYSSIGHLYGDADNDELVSDASSPGMGSSQVLSGSTGADCLWDVNGTSTSCDCGGQVVDNRHQSHSCSNCDATPVLCCGLC